MTQPKVHIALAFLKSQPAAAAGVLEQLPVTQVAEFISSIPHTHSSLVLEKVLPQYIAKLCAHMDPQVSASILSLMEIRSIVPALRCLQSQRRDVLLSLLPDKTKVGCKLLLTYSEATVGAWMVSDIVTLPADCDVKEALVRLKLSNDAQNSGHVFVVDRDKKLQGYISVTEVMRAPETSFITKIMHAELKTISGQTTLAAAINHPSWQNNDVVAIVNRRHEFVGILRHADLRKGLSRNHARTTPMSGTSTEVNIINLYGKCLYSLFEIASDVAGVRKA